MIRWDHPLKSGDQIRFNLQSTQTSFVTLNRLDKTGSKVNKKLGQSKLMANETLFIPNKNAGTLKLDGNVGLEWLQLVIAIRGSEIEQIKQYSMSTTTIKNLEQVVLRKLKLSTKDNQKILRSADNKTLYFALQQAATSHTAIHLNMSFNHNSE